MFKKDPNRSKNKHCVDCGISIINTATRCRKCASQIRTPAHTRKCDFCGLPFQSKISRVNKSGKYYCSNDCKKKAFNKICEWCGKEFHSKWNEKYAVYCSIDCRSKAHRKKKIKLVCMQCGKKFKRLLCQIHNPDRIFCCLKCKQDWWKGENHSSYVSEERVCQICGKKFVTTKGKISVGKGKYCSRKCNTISQTLSSNEYYGIDWPEQRRKARKRDKYICRVCGVTEERLEQKLSVHHIIPFRRFGTKWHLAANRLVNLLSVCRKCHRLVEKKKILLPDDVQTKANTNYYLQTVA